jgi:hypothetical protein
LNRQLWLSIFLSKEASLLKLKLTGQNSTELLTLDVGVLV